MSNSINGLELKTPGECGYADKDRLGAEVKAILFLDGSFSRYLFDSEALACANEYGLVPLPKPKTYRPYKRGEVKCGDVFREKKAGIDRAVIAVTDRAVIAVTDGGVVFHGWTVGYQYLFDRFHRLTYENGVETLTTAGIEES